MSRNGAPCSAGSGRPFMAYATIASEGTGSGSERSNVMVRPRSAGEPESAPRNRISTALSATPASSSRVRERGAGPLGRADRPETPLLAGRGRVEERAAIAGALERGRDGQGAPAPERFERECERSADLAADRQRARVFGEREMAADEVELARRHDPAECLERRLGVERLGADDPQAGCLAHRVPRRKATGPRRCRGPVVHDRMLTAGGCSWSANPWRRPRGPRCSRRRGHRER